MKAAVKGNSTVKKTETRKSTGSTKPAAHKHGSRQTGTLQAATTSKNKPAIAPKAKKESVQGIPCCCGCGTITKVVGRKPRLFVAGHDMKLKSALLHGKPMPECAKSHARQMPFLYKDSRFAKFVTATTQEVK